MQMNRRTFLQSAAAAGSIAGLAGCICPCCSRAKTQVAVQLYSVRGLMNDKAGFKKTLKDVKILRVENEKTLQAALEELAG